MPDRPPSPLRRFHDVRVGLCLRTALRGTGNPGPNANNEVNQTHVAEAKPSRALDSVHFGEIFALAAWASGSCLARGGSGT